MSLSKWSGPALAHITHQGGGNFAVWNYGRDAERIDLLVNTIGSYEGTLPLDFIDGEATVRFEVTAGGSWTIEVLPLEQIRRVEYPSTFEGQSDDVVYLDGRGTPDVLKVDGSQADGNLAVWAYGNVGRDLLVNEIAPYQGSVVIPKGTFLLVIHAERDWSMEITTR